MRGKRLYSPYIPTSINTYILHLLQSILKIGWNPCNTFVYWVKTRKKMEILFFINGMLTLMVVGITYVNLKLKSKIDDFEADLVDQQYDSVDNYNTFKKYINDHKLELINIQTKLNTDEYQNISKLSSKVSELNEITLAANKKVDDLGREHEKQTSALFSEIQQLKNNLKGLNQNDFR